MGGAEVYIFPGGGTGGHVYPGLAVAAELTRLRPGARIVFACSNRPIDRRILDPEPYAIVPQPVRPLPRGARQLAGFAWAWWRSGRLARDLVGDLRPRAVLGLGGYAAGPVVKRAARRGVPTALVNPDAVPGKANRYLAKYADVIFTQFGSTRECFAPRVRDKVRCVGCPVRRAMVHGDRDEALRHFGLDPARKTLFVQGGSQGAANINQAVLALADDLDELAETWQVLHVAGPGQGDEVFRAAAERRIQVRPLEYCHRMDLAYAAADLVLGRSGAGTVAELSATGTPAVVMPYPYHADQQQRRNAASLAEAAAAVICPDEKDASRNAEGLRGTLMPIMRDASVLAGMLRSARVSARPEAAQAVAAWLAGGHEGAS